LYHQAKYAIQDAVGDAALERSLELRFHRSDRTLSVRVDDTNVRVVIDLGSVFVVQLGDDGQVRGVSQTAERVSQVLDAADVARLLSEAKAD
jgi:hypothetical protein